MSPKCQVCSNEKLVQILDLGSQPPSDAFVKAEDAGKAEVRYPLRVFYCDRCNLVQLDYAIEPEILFGENYVYRSGFSGPLKEHFRNLTESLVERFDLGRGSLAVDIGSNDGTLLEGYLSHGVGVLGVEPSGVAAVCEEKGIPVVRNFFGEALAHEIVKKHGNAKVVTATNVFAHVRELESFVNGVKVLLGDSGVFATESHYLVNLVRNLEYDTIYHEHLRYYSLRSLVNLFDRFDMEVFDAELIPTHGGSILVFACKKGKYQVSDSVARILKSEEDAGVGNIGTFKEFAVRVAKNREVLRRLLLKIKSGGGRIVGIGAPAKSTTLMNFCGIGPDILDYVVEKSDWKVGRLTPGTRIKILDESRLFDDQPEYALLLSWNLKDDIVPKLRKNGYKGKIIVPVPEPVVLRD